MQLIVEVSGVSQVAVGERATADCCRAPLWTYRHPQIDVRLGAVQAAMPASRLAAVRATESWTALAMAEALVGQHKDLQGALIRAGHVRSLAQCEALVREQEAKILLRAREAAAKDLINADELVGNFTFLFGPTPGSVVLFEMTRAPRGWYGITFDFNDKFPWSDKHQIVVNPDALSA